MSPTNVINHFLPPRSICRSEFESDSWAAMGFFDNDPGVPPGVELETAPDEEAPALRRTEPALSEGEKRGGTTRLPWLAAA